jgi:hypothetical protein
MIRAELRFVALDFHYEMQALAMLRGSAGRQSVHVVGMVLPKKASNGLATSVALGEFS